MANLYDSSYQQELGPRRRALLEEYDSPNRAPSAGQTGLAPSPGASPAPTEDWQRPPSPAPSPVAATDPRSRFTSIYGQYGLDPNNPGHGLANVDYFLTRLGQTDPNDVDYWAGGGANPQGRLEQEIRKSLYGEVGNLIDTGGGRGGLDLGSLFAQMQQAQANDPTVQAQRAALLRILNQGDQPIDVQNDATLGPAAAAYKTARRQGANEDRAALAERAAFTGLNSGGQGSGAFESGVQGINEQASQDIAGNQASLALNELSARRQQFAQALQLADAIGARSESAQLQTRLAQIDAEMRKYGYDQQQGQFEDTQAFNWAKLIQDANRDALLQGLGG